MEDIILNASNTATVNQNSIYKSNYYIFIKNKGDNKMSKYPEGVKDTFLCLTGIKAWPYTKVVSVEDGVPTLETQCIKKSSYSEQKGNVVDTASNAAQAKYLTGPQGATVATGTGALAGGVAILSAGTAILRKDYDEYMQTGNHYSFNNQKLSDCLSTINWEKYPDFETALKSEGMKCKLY